MQQTPDSGSQAAGSLQQTPSGQVRQSYEAPRVTPLGEWTALTLAGSTPVLTGLPLFGQFS